MSSEKEVVSVHQPEYTQEGRAGERSGNVAWSPGSPWLVRWRAGHLPAGPQLSSVGWMMI